MHWLDVETKHLMPLINYGICVKVNKMCSLYIAKIFLKLALNTNQFINQLIMTKDVLLSNTSCIDDDPRTTMHVHWISYSDINFLVAAK